MIKKRCKKCGIEKEISEFHKESKMKDGYRNECKQCRNSYRKGKYYENHSHELERRKNHREDNLEAVRKRERELYLINRDKHLIKARKYRKENKDKLIDYAKKNQKRLMKNSSLKIKYGSIHDYINHHKKKPKYCKVCNEGKKLQLACINHNYTRKLEDYLYLCVSCHILFDKCYKKREIIYV